MCFFIWSKIRLLLRFQGRRSFWSVQTLLCDWKTSSGFLTSLLCSVSLPQINLHSHSCILTSGHSSPLSPRSLHQGELCPWEQLYTNSLLCSYFFVLRSWHILINYIILPRRVQGNIGVSQIAQDADCWLSLINLTPAISAYTSPWTHPE